MAYREISTGIPSAMFMPKSRAIFPPWTVFDQHSLRTLPHHFTVGNHFTFAHFLLHHIILKHDKKYITEFLYARSPYLVALFFMINVGVGFVSALCVGLPYRNDETYGYGVGVVNVELTSYR
jgi:hypothetical protein